MHRVLDAMNIEPCLRGIVECLYTDIQVRSCRMGTLRIYYFCTSRRATGVLLITDIIRAAIRSLRTSRPNMSGHRRG